jgi:methionine synthase II (cobalamin-independent)
VLPGRLALWLEFGDAGKVLGEAAELPVEGIGIDFYGTHIEDVPSGFDKLLLAGVVDARSSVVEDPRELAAFVGRLDVERIALVPNGDLQYVSEPIAREKLARLGQAKTATTEAAA